LSIDHEPRGFSEIAVGYPIAHRGAL